jgi:hypothetical protein
VVLHALTKTAGVLTVEQGFTFAHYVLEVFQQHSYILLVMSHAVHPQLVWT